MATIGTHAERTNKVQHITAGEVRDAQCGERRRRSARRQTGSGMRGLDMGQFRDVTARELYQIAGGFYSLWDWVRMALSGSVWV